MFENEHLLIVYKIYIIVYQCINYNLFYGTPVAHNKSTYKRLTITRLNHNQNYQAKQG